MRITTEVPLRVLVVDSDPSIRHLLVLIFQRVGWQVTSAGDGGAALNLLRADLPDLLVLDLMLPRVSGFEVLDWIRSTDATWLGHVIVLTGVSSRILERLTNRHDVCRVLRKPFDIEELLGNVESCASALGIVTSRHDHAGSEVHQ